MELRRRNLEGARDFFRKAVAKGRLVEGYVQGFSTALYNLADSERRLGNSLEALAGYLEVWELEEHDSSLRPRALCQAANLEVQLGRLASAEKHVAICSEAWAQWPGNEHLKVFPLYVKGLILIEKESFQEAAEVLEDVLRLRKAQGASQSVIQLTQDALEKARSGQQRVSLGNESESTE